MSSLQPLSDYVVTLADKAEAKTSGGIYLPENTAEKPKTAKVVSVGRDVTQVKSGDRIVYKNYASTDIKLDGKEYVLVKEEDIIAIVK